MHAMIWVGILCTQAALFYGAVLGLALSLGSLHLQRVRREAAGAIELAQQQAQAAVRALITLAGAQHRGAGGHDRTYCFRGPSLLHAAGGKADRAAVEGRFGRRRASQPAGPPHLPVYLHHSR